MEHTQQDPASNVTARPFAQVPPASKRRKVPGGRKWLAVGVAALVLLVLVAASVWLIAASRKPYDENVAIHKSEYQAIFLTNGQVYFGKLSDLNHKYVTLTNIYYLQVQQGGSLQNASSTASSDSKVSLAKLGSELHGPEDKMSIASDQVLFWENLKSDSKVVQAITKYQNQ